MKLLLNGQEIGFTLENEKTVGDILRSLEIECEKNDATIIRISVNNSVIEADKIEELNNLDIAETEQVDVTTVSSNDILQSMKDLIPDLEALTAKLEELPVILQGGDFGKVGAVIKTFTDNFDILCHLATLTALFPIVFADKKIDGMSISDFIKSFSPVLIDFEKAFSSSDTVLTGDLAEYELKPRLENYINAVRSF